MAEAPSRRTSIRRTLPGAISLVSGLTTGTSNSVWKPGCRFIRRPLINSNVFPVPKSRKFTDPTSPRTLFWVVAVCSLNALVPFCGSARNNSSPDDAPVFSICCSSRTVTGRTSLICAPWIREPVTTIDASASSVATVAASCAYAIFAVINAVVLNNATLRNILVPIFILPAYFVLFFLNRTTLRTFSAIGSRPVRDGQDPSHGHRRETYATPLMHRQR